MQSKKVFSIANIETLCANAGGTVINATSGTFCISSVSMNWYEAKEWCLSNGMEMPFMKEICPSGWAEMDPCPELDVASDRSVVIWSDSTWMNPETLCLCDGGTISSSGKDHSTFGDFAMYAFCR